MRRQNDPDYNIPKHNNILFFHETELKLFAKHNINVALKLKQLKVEQIELRVEINKYGIIVENDDGKCYYRPTMADRW